MDVTENHAHRGLWDVPPGGDPRPLRGLRFVAIAVDDAEEAEGFGVRIAQLVDLQDGRYVVAQQPAAVAVTGYRQTIHGTVTEVDDDEIQIHTAKEDFEIRMPGANRTSIRKGYNVTIDMTFTPATPAALPR